VYAAPTETKLLILNGYNTRRVRGSVAVQG
jgi:hypothetical protein